VSETNEFLAKVLQFRDNDDQDFDATVIAEVAATYADGTVEIAATLPTKRRIYLRFALADLVRIVVQSKPEPTP